MSNNGKTDGAVKVADRQITIIDPKEIVFDSNKITMFDLEDLMEAEKTVKMRDMAKIFMRSIVKLPDGWGDPHDIETYRLPKAQWGAVVKAWLKAVGDSGE